MSCSQESAYLVAQGLDDWGGQGRRLASPGFNPERLHKLIDNYISSNAKIKSALGVGKMPIGARDGLKVMLESFAK